MALYAVASDVDGFEIAQEMRLRTHAAICSLLETASDGPVRDLDLVATVYVGIMSGLSRQLLESENPEQLYPGYRAELRVAVAGYLESCRPSRTTLIR